MDNQRIQVQLNLEDFKQHFGAKSWDSALEMAKTMKKYLENSNSFTGKIVFTVNCHNGGIGNVEAHIQKKLI
jgi:hypothetical protein